MVLEDRRLRRVHDVTANFFFWQGLRWVPMGAALLVVAWSLGSTSPVPASWESSLLLGSMVAASVLSAAVGRWYGRSYGRVRGIPGMHARRTRIKWLIVYPVLLVALVIDGVARPPVLLSGLAFALAIEAYRRSTGGGRAHYVVASIVFAALTLAPVLGLTAPGADALNLLFAFLGATYMIGGVLDHLELRRLLPGIPDREMTPTDGVASAAGSR